MQLTLKLILDELKYEVETQPVENPTFSSVELFTANGADLSGNTLLITTLSEALQLERHKGIYLLCVRDRMVDSLETQEALCGLIIVKKNVELRMLFNLVQRVFTKIGSWVLDMQSSMLREKGLQDLMNLSEQVIGNHIDVMDATFKLMAYTKNIETDDEVTNNLLMYGYHPDETISRLRMNRRFEQFEEADNDGIIVSADYSMSDYVVVKKIYKYNNSYSIIVVMVCCAREYTGGLLDLFRILLEHINIYVERSWLSQGSCNPCESLISELIDRNLRQEEEVENRAAYAKIPFEGCFELFQLVLGDTLNTPVNRVILELTDVLAEAWVILYNRNILVLNLYKNKDAELSRAQRLEHIWRVLGEQIECCGISNTFGNLMDLPAAYGQAEAAAAAGERLRGATDQPDKAPYNYRFEDYYLHYMLEYCIEKAPDIFRHSQAFDMVKALCEYDEKHKTKTLYLLYTYLQWERSATETCTRLHMHRNTVLYHINKIEELLNIDLSDPDVRLKLLMGYKAYELGIVKP